VIDRQEHAEDLRYVEQKLPYV